MRTSLLWAAAIATTIFVLASVDRSAEARDRGARYYSYTAMPRVVVAPRPVMGYRPMTVAKPAPAAKAPGLCGTYMYWKGGKCNDARLK